MQEQLEIGSEEDGWEEALSTWLAVEAVVCSRGRSSPAGEVFVSMIALLWGQARRGEESRERRDRTAGQKKAAYVVAVTIARKALVETMSVK